MLGLDNTIVSKLSSSISIGVGIGIGASGGGIIG